MEPSQPDSLKITCFHRHHPLLQMEFPLYLVDILSLMCLYNVVHILLKTTHTRTHMQPVNLFTLCGTARSRVDWSVWEEQFCIAVVMYGITVFS